MFPNHPYEALILAHEHARRLRDDAAPKRRPDSAKPRITVSLRCATPRDRAPLAHRPA